jgi:hypothetical protein
MYDEAEATETERVKVLANKDAAKSFYIQSESVIVYAEQQSQAFLQKMFFKKFGYYQLLHDQAKEVCDAGNEFEPPVPPVLVPAAVRLPAEVLVLEDSDEGAAAQSPEEEQ